jgi:hypothetical protein
MGHTVGMQEIFLVFFLFFIFFFFSFIFFFFLGKTRPLFRHHLKQRGSIAYLRVPQKALMTG